jgi:hypothetical protein
MAWQVKNGRPTYYRSVRVGRSVRRVYVGTGHVAEQAAAEDVHRRAERRARDEARREEEERWAEAEAPLGEFIRLTEILARAALMAAGYFRHNRGSWRHRRNMSTATKPTATPPESPRPTPPTPEEVAELEARKKIEELVRRAEQGDASVMPQLARILDMAPSMWRSYGDLGARVEATWLSMMAGQNLMLRESWRRELAELRAEVGGDAPSPLERLLAGRVAAAWMQVQCADAGAATVQGGPEEAIALRRQNAAQKRLLQATRTLAVVRRLLQPRVSPVQVATRLSAGDSGGVRKSSPPAEGLGVGVLN